MKKVEKISKEEKKNLKEIKKHHPKYRERERATGILLSYSHTSLHKFLKQKKSIIPKKELWKND
ncbi:MAG: hypothetical protein KU29_12965 [Sulfurovum sp. FS06-10]|nr:MAG: hypothetical protein KU29_12965 [Sulfurovum sp. FS06-10]